MLKASIALINDGSCTLPGFSGATLWCANATAQGNELCYGDTGAPLVSKVSGQLSVFGISLPKVQFGGAHNCVMGMQSAMVDVTAPAIRTWIVNTIRATSPRGLNTSLGGSAGFGGEQIAPSDNDMTQVDVSSVFPSGIRIGTTVTTTLSVNANGVVALGSVTKLDKVINPATYTGAPLFMVFGADADPSLGEIKAPVGGKSSGANRVWVAKDATNGVVTITWDDVRPAKGILSEQYIGNTFQVQFRRENTSDVRVTYRYGMLQWTFSETMCSLPGCLGGGNRVTYAQVGYVSGQARGAGNLIHTNSGNDAKLRALVSHEYVVRDGIVGPERPTATSSSTRTMTRTSTPTRTQTPTRTMTASMTPTASRTSQRTNALFGTGRDGVYTVNAGQVVTFPQLYLTPTADVIYAGNAFITFASDISGLRVGDELLIVQMKAGSDLAYAGRNEFVTVKTIDTVAKRITLDTALLNTYQPTLEGAVVQVVQVKHFTNVTINGELQPASWNGTTGGLMAFRVSGALTGVGRIEASGRGYRGGVLHHMVVSGW